MHHMIVIRKVKYFFPNLFPRNRDMGDRLEARLNAIENIEENLDMTSGRWKSIWPDWQVCWKITSGPKQCILKDHHQINKSLDLSPGLRAISHMELIAPTCGNQYPQLRPPSRQLLDMSISRATQGANPTNKRLTKTSSDRIPSPLATPNYSQNWYEVVTSSQFSFHLSDPHSQDGTIPTLDATTTAGIQVIPRKITPHSNLRSKSWLMVGN